ncbi:MAG: AbrB/MazE/SpoVT family DNA-binding domain-containing protein [Candidatus Diapherotrites archaeon]|nr:AbrB/MazE/SpoVT family DNA-binding domain-containing protein [Candidatus Diapherotrites archaeon]
MKDNENWMICARCGKKAYGARLRIQGSEIDGWKCKCGEEYLEPIQAERLLLQNKLKSAALEVKLGRIRSNLIVRIPKRIEEALELKSGEKVMLKVISEKKLEMIAK